MSNPNFHRADARRSGAVIPLLIAAAIIGVVAASYAMGQAETLDADGDGMVTYTELLMVMPEVTEAEFSALDANSDGMLDSEELAAAEQAGLITTG